MMPAIKTARTVWIVRAGRKKTIENQEQFALDSNLIVITYRELGNDIRSYRCSTYHQTEQKIAEAMGKASWHRPRQCCQFAFQIEIGDLVMLPLRFIRRKEIAVGKVVGDYDYRPENSKWTRHRRPVEWLSTTFPRSLLRDGAENPVVKSLLNLANCRGTVAEVNCENSREAAEKLLSLLAKDPSKI